MTKLPECVFDIELVTVDLLAEILPLLASHWREVAHYPDIPLDPDFEFYKTCAANGALRCYTIRRLGTLLGYAIFFVRRNPHYQNSVQATQDVLYVSPEIRGMVPIRFLHYCDNTLRAEGVQVVYHHIKVAHEVGPVLERMGYERVDNIYARRLDKER